MKDGNLTTIDSVVIRYSSLCFACFQTRDIFSTRDRAPFLNYPVPMVNNSIMNSFPSERPPVEPPFPTVGGVKRRRSVSDDVTTSMRPAPLSLSASVGANIRPFYDDRFSDAISPTVASGAAILGSFQNYRPPFPTGDPYPYTSTASASPASYNGGFDNFNPNYPYLGSSGPSQSAQGSSSNTLPSLQMPSFMAYQSPQFNEYGHIQNYNAAVPPRHNSASPNPSIQSSAAENAAPPPPRTNRASTSKKQDDAANRACASCGTTNSPEWRKGPNGTKSLCNACGECSAARS
jgi:hypothetical protein